MESSQPKWDAPVEPPLKLTRSAGPGVASSVKFWPGALLILLLTVFAYWPVYSAGYIWDDDEYVTQNHCLRDLSGLRQIWFDPAATPQYYPLVFTTFWLEYHLWALNPRGFHVDNVLLHVAGALLLWRLLARLQMPGAWLAAAIFALHPVEVESVAWISERKNVLSAVFYFSAALAYLRFARMHSRTAPERAASGLSFRPGMEERAEERKLARSRSSAVDERKKNQAVRGRAQFALGNGGLSGQWRWHHYALALLLFVAALLSKTVTASLPAALLLVVWWKKGRLKMADILPLTPFFLLGANSGLATAWLEKHHVGASGADWAFSVWDRILIAGHALCFYTGKLVFPFNLSFVYPRWKIDSGLWWQWLFPLAALGVVAVLWLARRRLGRGPLVAVLFFAGSLFPALGFVNVYPMRFSFVADHFQYLAGAGLIVLGAAWLGRFPRALSAVLLGICCWLTWSRCGAYQNLETLWADTLVKNPACWLAYSNLGRWQADQGLFSQAETNYLAALQINPRGEDAQYDYANLLARTGRLDLAVTHYQLALENNPARADIHNNLGAVLLKQNLASEAILQFREAAKFQPGAANYHYNLGCVLAMEHQVDEAVIEFRHALQLDPDSELIKRRLRSLGASVN